MYKHTPNEERQQAIFQAFGLQWSMLLNLPYWNPVLYTIIESMHALDLSLFQHHCHELFQIDVTTKGGDGFTEAPAPRNKCIWNGGALHDCMQVIHSNEPGLLNQLLKFHCKVLYTICIDHGIRGLGNTVIVSTRWVLSHNIYSGSHNWVNVWYFFIYCWIALD